MGQVIRVGAGSGGGGGGATVPYAYGVDTSPIVTDRSLGTLETEKSSGITIEEFTIGSATYTGLSIDTTGTYRVYVAFDGGGASTNCEIRTDTAFPTVVGNLDSDGTPIHAANTHGGDAFAIAALAAGSKVWFFTDVAMAGGGIFEAEKLT